MQPICLFVNDEKKIPIEIKQELINISPIYPLIIWPVSISLLKFLNAKNINYCRKKSNDYNIYKEAKNLKLIQAHKLV